MKKCKHVNKHYNCTKKVKGVKKLISKLFPNHEIFCERIKYGMECTQYEEKQK